MVVVSITQGRRFSSPSINHYKRPIQEEKAYVASGNGRSRSNSRMQQGQRDKLRFGPGGRSLLFSGAAAEHIHNLLHYAGLLGLLLPCLLRLRARRWNRTVS
jgi:hypothetical protein